MKADASPTTAGKKANGQRNATGLVHVRYLYFVQYPDAWYEQILTLSIPYRMLHTGEGRYVGKNRTPCYMTEYAEYICIGLIIAKDVHVLIIYIEYQCMIRLVDRVSLFYFVTCFHQVSCTEVP